MNPDTPTNHPEPPAQEIVIHWGGKKFVFHSAEAALAAGFHLEVDHADSR